MSLFAYSTRHLVLHLSLTRGLSAALPVTGASFFSLRTSRTSPSAAHATTLGGAFSISTRSLHFIIIGPPGAGKGTISNKLVKDFNLAHVSTGDLLRAEIRAGSEIGKQVKAIVDGGGLVPDDLVCNMIIDAKNKQYADRRLLLDGFPRTVKQAEILSSKIPDSLALVLDIPFDVIVDRISKRWIHEPSGRTYAYDYNPPKKLGFDDVTGEKLTQRPDDTKEAVLKRLQTFEQQTGPVVEFFKKLGKAKVFSGTESNVIYVDLKKYCVSLLEENKKSV